MTFQIGYTKFSLLYDSTYSFDESGRRNQNMFFFIYGKCKNCLLRKAIYFSVSSKKS